MKISMALRSISRVGMTLLAMVAAAAAQDPDDEYPEYRPGLIAHYRGRGGSECRRTDEVIKFVWHDKAADPRLLAGEFSAHWQGRLFTIEPGDYQLHVYVAGEVELSLNGESLLKTTAKKAGWYSAQSVKLAYGYHPLEIRYRSAKAASELALFWQGPRFQLEPLPAWHLLHEPAAAVSNEFQQGQRLVRALRCGACHEMAGDRERLAAPSLAKLSGNLRREWLIEWLVASHSPAGQGGSEVSRRMPQFTLDRSQARAIADVLVAQENSIGKPLAGDPARGERLFLTTGCLACHQVGTLGKATLFGGGDLTQVARKRPPDYFARWLSDPAAINPAHRMPIFKLSDEERSDLSAYLATLGKGTVKSETAEQPRSAPSGRELLVAFRCATCHALDDDAIKATKRVVRLNAKSDWSKSCLTTPRPGGHQPGYGLGESTIQAIRTYISEVGDSAPGQPDGAFVLEERNCIGCHARGPEGGIAALLPAVVERAPELAQELPLLTAPSLLGVGDKFHEKALEAAISTKESPRRPWLTIRMPRFPLAETEMEALVGHFVEQDRIPEGAPERPISKLPGKKEMAAAGARAVTADGFGCTSCHKIGDWTPKKVAINAQGTELSLLGDRLRKPWFDRWVRNPARIVPRMEMPSIVVPARKILNENLDHQLAAVWQVLNQRGFTPPLPSAIRLVNTTNRPEAQEPAQVLTDVLETDRHVFIRPLLIALPNRHNVLIDQETNSLAGWWTGDAALERTRGKSWYWEPAGVAFWPLGAPTGTDLTLRIGDRELTPEPQGQHIAPFDWLEHIPGGIRFGQRLRFLDAGATSPLQLTVTQSFTALWPEAVGASGFRRNLTIEGVPNSARIAIQSLPAMPQNTKEIQVRIAKAGGVAPPSIDATGFFELAGRGEAIHCELAYTSMRPVDQATPLPPPPALPAAPLHVTPGYEGVRLPLAETEMPTALAWREDGALIVCSLKGRVCLAHDTDGDGLEDRILPFSCELAAPYGAAAHDGAIDVITKSALLRLFDADKDGLAERTVVLASGWGHSADYHDWAVGLPRDKQGNYYIALPCQQDERSPAAAHLRGRGVKISPRSPTKDNPQLYGIEAFCEGLRFPMGLAMNRQGQLFATDNQGNYNPFNELNHLLPGRHYGFINKLEFKAGKRPRLTAPAIDIPHPWTRSVNGVCFLETPPAVQKELGRSIFGPHEGHLIGCEYDTRQLVRMSLQQVGDSWQGAIYPFTTPPQEDQASLQGPVCCEVSPAGDLYVGSMRDSGWGGGANVGSIVRLRPTGNLPAGIAEVRAVPKGFVIDFTKPLDAARAMVTANYSLSSYRRVSTPAYGGPDVDRQTDSVKHLELSGDRRSVRLELGELRPGFVYELRLKDLASAGELFYPAEAHYTVRVAPQ